MKKKRRQKLNKLALGGALIGSAFLISLISIKLVSGYDQQNTHPALTDEAIDFYNLNFPDNQLSEKDKQLLIRGVIEEDVPPRYLNHFYDPVYNRSWSDYTTSKEWALNSATQQSFTDSAFSYGGFANLFSDNLSPTDFSYPRALHDYASGKRERAMLAMGHILHLLEDANVPEHTRGDIHLWWHGTESPYEHTMAKWSPNNIDIANKLFKESKKPILLSQLGDYFDAIANYSNNYFFSQDTIGSVKYSNPKILKIETRNINGKNLDFAIGVDRNKNEFILAQVHTRLLRNIIETKDATLKSKEFGDLILDEYWSRLAPDFVVNGAGALRLFLEQAELVKREYAKNEFKRRDSGLIGQFLSFLGFSGSGEGPVLFNPAQIESIINQPEVLGESTQDVNDVSNRANDVATMPTPLALSPTPSPTPTQLFPGNLGGQTITVPPTTLPLSSPLSLGSGINGQSSPTPSPTPLFFSGSGGPSGTATPTATPTPLLTATPTSTPTPTPSPTLISTPTPSLTPTPFPTPTRQIVINEIAWMGTGSTATLSSDEWLELYNPTSLPVDVGGWQLVSLTDNSPNITLASKTISPYGFFLLERTSDDTISDISADQIYTGNLNDGGEVFELRDNQGNLHDLVSKSDDGKWYAGDKTTRSSMERVDPLKPGNDSTNWATNNGLIRNGKNAAGDFINSTPKARNNIYFSQKPSVISDLAVDSTLSFFDKVKLFWSAPKDDDTLTAGLRYAIRYSTNDFNADGDWGNAAIASDFSVPKPVVDFGRLQSVSFSIFDFSGEVPPDYKLLPFSFSVSPKIASDCLDIKAVGWYRDLPHPNDDLIAIYNTDTGQYRIHFSGYSGQPVCGRSSELPAGHYSAVIEHGNACHTNYGDYVYLPYSECKNNSGFEGEVLFTVSDREFAYNQDYYFAIKTSDGENWSNVSNIAKYQVKSAISRDPPLLRGPANPSIVWQFQVPDVFYLNQPAIAPDGTIYFGAPNNRTNKPRLYAIGPDGVEKWHLENNLAVPSEPVVSSDGAVYFGQFDPGAYVTALNPDGGQRWQYNISDRVNNASIDAKGNVYFTSENRDITKLKPNGQLKWRVLNNFTFGFTPLADVDDDIYVGANISGLPGFYKLSGNDGATIWQTRVNDNFIYSMTDPVYDKSQNKFYATAGDGQILTINRADGEISKNFVDRQGVLTTKAAVLTDSLVFGLDFGLNRPASGSLVYAVNKVDKAVIWTFAVDSPVKKRIAVDVDENLYFATHSGVLYSLDKNGQKRWVIDMGIVTDTYPVLGNNAVFIGAGGKLFKISD